MVSCDTNNYWCDSWYLNKAWKFITKAWVLQMITIHTYHENMDRPELAKHHTLIEMQNGRYQMSKARPSNTIDDLYLKIILLIKNINNIKYIFIY